MQWERFWLRGENDSGCREQGQVCMRKKCYSLNNTGIKRICGWRWFVGGWGVWSGWIIQTGNQCGSSSGQSGKKLSQGWLGSWGPRLPQWAPESSNLCPGSIPQLTGRQRDRKDTDRRLVFFFFFKESLRWSWSALALRNEIRSEMRWPVIQIIQHTRNKS